MKRDGTRAETRFRLSPKRTSPFKSAWASVQSTAVSRGVRISGSNAGYTMLRGSVKSTGYPLHSPVSPSLPSCASLCAIRFQKHSAIYRYITRLASNKIFSPSKKYIGEVGQAKDLSAPLYEEWLGLRMLEYLYGKRFGSKIA